MRHEVCCLPRRLANGSVSLPRSSNRTADLPRAFRQSSCQAHGGRGRFIAGPAARRVSRTRRPRKRRARRARHVGHAVIARSPCDEAIQGRRHVRRQGAADGSAVAPGLLRRFAPRNDERSVCRDSRSLSAKVRIAWASHASFPKTSPRERRARRTRHVGHAVIARSPCDEAIQGRRHVRRQGAADGSAVAPGLLRRFAPRNDEDGSDRSRKVRIEVAPLRVHGLDQGQLPGARAALDLLLARDRFIHAFIGLVEHQQLAR